MEYITQKIVATSTILPRIRYTYTMMNDTSEIKSPAVGCMLGKAYQTLLTQLAEALDRNGVGITPAEYLVLRAVYSREGLQQCEIADMVGKDKSAVCRNVAALERKGIVRTEAVSHKCVRVYLTEKGIAQQPLVMKVAHARHEDLAGRISGDDLDVLIRVLDTIINQ